MQSTHDFMQRRVRRRLLLLGASTLALPAWAQSAGAGAAIRVAAASDLQLALPGIVAAFERETGLKVTVTYGASGNLARQLAQGLPMDIFMSADEALVARLHQSGWARDAGVVYAQGRLALVVPREATPGKTMPLDADLRSLENFSAMAGQQGKFSIANPEHAPYGRAAKAALEKVGLWQPLQPHLVLGENVSQATQFVSTGAAVAGLVALSLASSPELAKSIHHVAINPALHPPIIQRMALHVNAAAAAQRFYAHMQTEPVQRVLKSHGLG
jgi:molybdate transport system substrate-binding protein